MTIIKKFWILLVLGFILRVVIAAFTYHPDLNYQVIATAAYLKGYLDPYFGASQVFTGTTLDKSPMTYLLHLTGHLPARILVVEDTEDIFIKNRQQLFGKHQLWLFLIYAKLPFILFDLALGVLLTFLVTQNLKKKVLALWMFNPVAIWTSSAVGQNDIYATFFVVLTLVLLKKNLILAALAIGFGAAVKSFPFLLIPLLFAYSENFGSKVKLILVAFTPYFLTVLPYLPSYEFRQYALFAPQISKSFFAQIPLSGGESIIIFLTSLAFIYFIYFSQKRTKDDFIPFASAILLVVLSLTHFHIQWFLWVMPFLIIWSINNWRKGVPLAIATLFFSLMLMLFLFEASLQIRLFAPFWPQLNQALGFAEILSSEQLFLLKSFAASIFAAASFFLILRILRVIKES